MITLSILFEAILEQVGRDTSIINCPFCLKLFDLFRHFNKMFIHNVSSIVVIYIALVSYY